VFLTLYFSGTPEAVTLQALQFWVCSYGGFLNKDAFRIGKLSLWKIDKGLWGWNLDICYRKKLWGREVPWKVLTLSSNCHIWYSPYWVVRLNCCRSARWSVDWL